MQDKDSNIRHLHLKQRQYLCGLNMLIAAIWLLLTACIPISIIVQHELPVMHYYFLTQILVLVVTAIALVTIPCFRKLRLGKYALGLTLGVATVLFLSLTAFYTRGTPVDFGVDCSCSEGMSSPPTDQSFWKAIKLSILDPPNTISELFGCEEESYKIRKGECEGKYYLATVIITEVLLGGGVVAGSVIAEKRLGYQRFNIFKHNGEEKEL